MCPHVHTDAQEETARTRGRGVQPVRTFCKQRGGVSFSGFCADVLLACLHDQSKPGFFRGPVFFQPIRAFWKTFQIALIGWIKAGPPKKPLLF